jgi:DNA-binding transcriptional LysR family regulator
MALRVMADGTRNGLRRRRAPSIDAGRGRRFEHFYFLLAAAVGGLGVAMAPRPLVDDDLKLGRLVAPFGFTPSGRRYCLTCPTALAKARKVRTFCDWVVRAARSGSRPA